MTTYTGKITNADGTQKLFCYRGNHWVNESKIVSSVKGRHTCDLCESKFRK